jgi:uncharacterized protein (TIGR00369 family)
MLPNLASLLLPEGGPDGFPFAVARLRSIVDISSDASGAILDVDVERGFATPTEMLYGGTLFELTDLAMGIALAAQLGEGESFVTVELKHSIATPICAGRLCVRGRVTSVGGSTARLEGEVRDGGGALVAAATSACVILRGKDFPSALPSWLCNTRP